MEPLADILLSYEVSINLFVQTILILLLSVAFYKTLFILKNYKQGTSTALQYSLEKNSYLIITIIYLSLIIKTILLPFFTYTLNELSNIIPGAMCAAGVISANVYGEPLIVLKIFIVILTMLWLTLNREDLKSKNYKYFKVKMYFFLFIYTLIAMEIAIELLFFNTLTTVNPVSCCSNLYLNSKENNPLPFNISTLELVISFYALYVLVVLSSYFKQRYFLGVLAILYIYISYFSITYFFSTYVYQLPTHKCPYCLLQSDYYYIGYFIYFSLIVATYHALSSSLFNFKQNSYSLTIFWYSTSTLFISSNFFIYLIINRTFL